MSPTLTDLLGFAVNPPPGDASRTAAGDEMPSTVVSGTRAISKVPGVWTAVNAKDYGAVGDWSTNDIAALQAASDAVYNGGVGGGVVWLPHTGAQYRVMAALITYPHVRLVGEATRDSGASVIKADPAGNFTNGSYPGAAVIKQDGATTTFWHGGGIENIAVDCNNVPGLGGIRLWQPGENSKLDFVRVDNAGALPRTVADGVLNSTVTVTSATAAFTTEDVNAYVTGAGIPANTKINIVNSATSVTLNTAATATAAGVSLTINRPSDAVTFDGGAPTGYARSLNGINNSGTLLRLKNTSTGSWLIESLSGDANGGGLLRVSAAAVAADPVSITVVNHKAENVVQAGRMDPLFLLDNCDMVALNLIGGSALTGFAATDIVRIDQPVTARGGPSVHLTGIEGANPFQFAYTNIIRDTSTGKLIPAGPANGPRYYPDVLFGRDLLTDRLQQRITALTYSAAITPDASAGGFQTLTVTNATAFTINAPITPPTTVQSQELTIEILNSSGGAMGAITWNAAFVFPVAWANPANTKRRFAQFNWNGASWVCTALASADY